MTSNGDIPDSAYDSDDDALRAPADDAPLEERVLYTVETVKLGFAAQRRMRLQIQGVGDAVGILDGKLDAIADNLASLSGVVMRLESIALTTAAKQANHERESAPPTLDQLAEMRTAHDRQARALEKRAIRVDERMGDLDRRVGMVEGDVRETSKHAAVTVERAFEVLTQERDSVVDKLEKARDRVEERTEAKVEKSATVIAAREGRRWEAFKFIGAPFLLILAAILGAKLQACTGAPPLHIPAPATAPH